MSLALGSSSDKQTLRQLRMEIKSPSQSSPSGVTGAGGGCFRGRSPQLCSSARRKEKEIFLLPCLLKALAWLPGKRGGPHKGLILPPHPVPSAGTRHPGACRCMPFPTG